MRICTARLKYQAKLTLDEQALLHAAKLRGDRHEFEEDGTCKNTWTTFFFDMDTLPGTLFCKLDDIDQAFAVPTTEIENVRGTVVLNKIVNVAVPGAALFSITETQMLTDCCTERLQNEISSGWRIIAVCPQPDQRRPDYVLGR